MLSLWLLSLILPFSFSIPPTTWRLRYQSYETVLLAVSSSNAPTAHIDFRSIRSGNIVEYTSRKGTKQIALVNKRAGNQLDLVNELKQAIAIPSSKVNFHIQGDFKFEDLAYLNTLLNDMKPHLVEKLWEKATQSSSCTTIQLDLEYIGDFLYGRNDSVGVFASGRLMATYGSLFFSKVPLDKDVSTAIAKNFSVPGNVSVNSQTSKSSSSSVRQAGPLKEAAPYRTYTPLTACAVDRNLRDRAVLKEFKTRLINMIKNSNHVSEAEDASEGRSSNRRSSSSTDNQNFYSSKEGFDDLSQPSISSTSESGAAALAAMPAATIDALSRYKRGLTNLVVNSHPWIARGIAAARDDSVDALEATEAAKEFLGFLELAPTPKNARRVLELSGMWQPHFNIEKHVMRLRDSFPAEVLDETQYLLEHSRLIPDPDERLRRDLRHLRSYAIDPEGSAEADDAISIEYLDEPSAETGHEEDADHSKSSPQPPGSTGRKRKEKLWIHISDVSRWIRPGSQLSLEAERRMMTVYMPDDRISMFPEVLTSELLSLGVGDLSYALSCGIILNERGEVESYEVCPSKICVTRRLTYAILEDMLSSTSAASGGQSVGTASIGDDNTDNESAVDDASRASNRSLGIGDNALLKTEAGIISAVDGDDSAVMTKTRSSVAGIDGDDDEEWSENIRARASEVLSASVTPTENEDTVAAVVKAVTAATERVVLRGDARKDRRSERRERRKENGAPGGGGPVLDESSAVLSDLRRLNEWAKLRHNFRLRRGALDTLLHQKTELALFLRMDPKSSPPRRDLIGHVSWSNTSSVSLVAEYMILMSETIGQLCSSLRAPVWYKVQSTHPPLQDRDREILPGEDAVMRASRLMRHLKAADDSKVPGPHATSGCPLYVQCTSPIRRYHDLYNHWRLKGALHGASLGEAWQGRAADEAGIRKLDAMASAQERLDTLRAIKLVTKTRYQYWLQLYIEKLLAADPKIPFDCILCGSIDTSSLLSASPTLTSSPPPRPTYTSSSTTGHSEEIGDEIISGVSATQAESCAKPSQSNNVTNAVCSSPSKDIQGYFYEALILQLGTFAKYRLYSPTPLLQNPGEVLKCFFYKLHTNPLSQILIPPSVELHTLPAVLRELLADPDTAINAVADART